MFNPTQPMMARLRLTTKQVNGGYYKGNRTGSMGRLTKHGAYIPDPSKHRNYVPAEKLEIPGKEYTEETAKEPFTLYPFITKHMRKTPSNYVQDIERNGRKVTVIRGFQGRDYLEKWAETGEAEKARRADIRRKKAAEAEEAVSKA
ncbi:50S ribosomal protein YmL27 [Penicillium sp. DV-2018c]|nr:50S ribosomal protein YmL27 [Penicillium sp. DV-2018c]KAJ5572201.1 50S ribosomal protein YmL27 [Penicillium sp. DV-2018c]